MSRYLQLKTIIDRIKPRTIVEIGTHRCTRSIRMIADALRHVDKVFYTGYDIFEHGGEEFQQAALNAKGTATEAHARNVLSGLSKAYTGRIIWNLVVGDTRKTLKGQQIIADLVFLDGDHRLATIRSDYEAVKASRVVVFDDFYLRDRGGRCPDATLYGANVLIYELMMVNRPEMNVYTMPIEDKNVLGGRIKLAVVERL